MELQLQHLCKHYGTKHAVNDVSTTLTPGVYGLLGANGAGKTTLMRMICGVLKPTSGNVCLNGKSIDELGEDYYAHLGYMPQDFGFYPDFTAREFMCYMAAVKGLDKKEATTRTKELLKLVNLHEVADKKIKSFSGGMKQRVLLAQALLNEPQILILDEPTAGLDPKERIRIRNYISSISENKIVLIATHVVSDVECIAKEILLLRSGKLLEKETPEKLVEQMEELVWEVIIRPDQLSELEQVLLVSNVNIAKEGLLVRVIAELEQMKEQQIQFGWGTPKAAVPTLEDVYLWNMGT